jgi:hypothetical protein
LSAVVAYEVVNRIRRVSEARDAAVAVRLPVETSAGNTE